MLKAQSMDLSENIPFHIQRQEHSALVSAQRRLGALRPRAGSRAREGEQCAPRWAWSRGATKSVPSLSDTQVNTRLSRAVRAS